MSRVVWLSLLLVVLWLHACLAVSCYSRSTSPINGAAFLMPKQSVAFTALPNSQQAPPARMMHWGTAINNYYVMYGGAEGVVGVGKIFNDMWSMDVNTGLWSIYPASGDTLAPTRTGSIGHVFSVINGIYYIHGGQDSNTIFGDVWSYSVTSGLWEYQAVPSTMPAPAERFQHAMVQRNNFNYFYVLMGQSSSSFLNDLWAFTPGNGVNGSVSGGTWSQVIPSTPDVPPALIRLQAGWDSFTDSLYVWWGVPERFNYNADPDALLWQFSWKTNSWQSFPMVRAISQPESCAWVYNRVLYMFGGVIPPFNVITNDLYALDLNSGPPYQFIRVNANYTLSNFAYLEPRRACDCEGPLTLPYLNINTEGIVFNGGATVNGPTNEVLFLDLQRKMWIQLRPGNVYPIPRTAHTAVNFGLSIFLFGGQDVQKNLLNDLWIGTLTPDASASTIQGLTWKIASVNSGTVPEARAEHAAAMFNGCLFVFGGRGLLQLGNRQIFSEFWQYVPPTGTWQLVIAPSTNTAYGPVGRYAHTLTVISKYIVMYGGVAPAGQVSELWLYNPNMNTWTSLTPVFPGALWPFPRQLHSASVFSYIVTASMLTVNRQFINSYQSRIASLLNGTTDAQMPSNVASMFPNVESGSTYVEYFAKLVKTALANVAASLNKLKEGDTQYALMIHGGASDSTIGSVNGDIWFYDLLTGLWQVPGNFNAASDVPNGNGRRGHVSHVFGQMVVTQGGQDDWTLRPASFAIGSLEPGAVSACNWPFDCFPRQMQQVIGQPVDAIASVALSSFQSLSVSFLLSMPPIIISSVCDWSYGAERSDLSQFYNSTTNSLVMPPNSAWSTVGMVSQHSSFQVGSGVVMLGGNGMMPSSTQPQPVPTAVNMRSWFAKLSPVCPFTTPVNLPALFASNLRQIISPVKGDVCAICAAGSFLNLSQWSSVANTGAVCTLCPPGTYAQVAGSVGQCMQCPAGFYSTAYGANSPRLCLPCPPGTYQSSTGATSCSICPGGTVCTVAAYQPLPSSTTVKPQVTQSQPQPMLDTTPVLTIVQVTVFGGCVALSMIAIGFFLVSRKFPAFQTIFPFEYLDVMFHGHHKIFTRPKPPVSKSEMWKEFYIYEWKTPLGGLFCVIACFGTFMLTLILALPYKYANLLESQSLVPSLTFSPALLDSIQSDMVITLKLQGFIDDCEQPAGSRICADGISFTNQGLYGATSQSMQCFNFPTSCEFIYKCTGCKLTTDDPSILFSFNTPLAYSSEISWNISQTSGIQTIDVVAFKQPFVPGGQLSSLAGTIYPKVSGQLMRGLNPSVLGLLLTSSVYQSVQAVGGVGMLVQYSWFTGGDSVSSQNFQISDGLSLRFQFSRSDTTFFTQQTTILTFFQTIASLSGALGALYAVTLAALGCFESLFFKSREKRRQKKEERMQRLKEIKIALDLKVPDPDAKPGDAPKMKLTDEEWAQLQADSQDTFSLFECMCCCFMVCLRKAAAEDEDLDIDEQLEAPAAAKSSAVSVAQKGDVEMTVTVAPPIKTSVSLPKIARTATAADIVPAPLNPLLASDPVDLRKPSTPPAMLRRKSTMMAPPPPPAGGVPIQKPALVTKLTLPPSS